MLLACRVCSNTVGTDYTQLGGFYHKSDAPETEFTKVKSRKRKPAAQQQKSAHPIRVPVWSEEDRQLAVRLLRASPPVMRTVAHNSTICRWPSLSLVHRNSEKSWSNNASCCSAATLPSRYAALVEQPLLSAPLTTLPGRCCHRVLLPRRHPHLPHRQRPRLRRINRRRPTASKRPQPLPLRLTPHPSQRPPVGARRTGRKSLHP